MYDYILYFVLFLSTYLSIFLIAYHVILCSLYFIFILFILVIFILSFSCPGHSHAIYPSSLYFFLSILLATCKNVVSVKFDSST